MKKSFNYVVQSIYTVIFDDGGFDEAV